MLRRPGHRQAPPPGGFSIGGIDVSFRRLCPPLALALFASLCLLGRATAQDGAVVFHATGHEQTFVVPAGVTSIHVVAVGTHGGGGAGAASASGGSGGLGSSAAGDISVSPGDS